MRKEADGKDLAKRKTTESDDQGCKSQELGICLYKFMENAKKKRKIPRPNLN